MQPNHPGDGLPVPFFIGYGLKVVPFRQGGSYKAPIGKTPEAKTHLSRLANPRAHAMRPYEFERTLR
jgi:hypothetical protein